jgi:3-hydroxyisobutyrate dehydrogenase-like beta-hydroxyacid dehydrogenase
MAELSPVGMIGLGLMGEAFSGLLRKAGYPVVGTDIDPAKAAKLAALGGQWADSAADVARDCPVIVLIVFNTDQVEAVLEREILAAVGESSGKIVLCASTCDPDRVAALGARVAPRGMRASG